MFTLKGVQSCQRYFISKYVYNVYLRMYIFHHHHHHHHQQQQQQQR